MTQPTESTLERALAQARAALGSETDVERLRAKLGPLPPPAAPEGGAASKTASLGTKIAAGAVAGVLLIAGGMLLVPRPSAPAARTQTSAEPRSAPMQASVPAPMPAPHTPAPSLTPAPQPTPEPKAPRRKLGKAAPTADVIEAPAAPPAASKELALLMSAQDAIEASPQRALGLLNEHARLYPTGNFAQERESLAIDTLRKLGRATEAKQRARAFIARFPKASNVKHLARWLDDSATSDHNDESRPLPTP